MPASQRFRTTVGLMLSIGLIGFTALGAQAAQEQKPIQQPVRCWVDAYGNKTCAYINNGSIQLSNGR